MNALVILFLTFSIIGFAKKETRSTQQNIQSVDGEYFKILNLVVGKRASIKNKEDASTKTAADKCKELGYKFRLAHYFVSNGSDYIITDLFCSNEKGTTKSDLATAIISRDRKGRGSSVRKDPYDIMKKFDNVEIVGFKTTELPTASDSAQKPTEEPPAKIQ